MPASERTFEYLCLNDPRNSVRLHKAQSPHRCAPKESNAAGMPHKHLSIVRAESEIKPASFAGLAAAKGSPCVAAYQHNDRS